MVWFVILISSLPPQTDKWSQSVFKHPAVTQGHVIVDVVSPQLLRGSTVDFSTKFISNSSMSSTGPVLSVLDADVTSTGRRKLTNLFFHPMHL